MEEKAIPLSLFLTVPIVLPVVMAQSMTPSVISLKMVYLSSQHIHLPVTKGDANTTPPQNPYKSILLDTHTILTPQVKIFTNITSVV